MQPKSSSQSKPAPKTISKNNAGPPSDLVGILARLEKTGLLEPEQAKQALITIRHKTPTGHPINQVGNLKLKSKANRKVLNPEFLAEWFADQHHIGYVRLDPLKIDVDSVTAVMSKAFAIRHQILACEVTKNNCTKMT